MTPRRPGLRAILRHPDAWGLAALALVTRLAWLRDPPAVVWDEVHFLRYTGGYLTGQTFLDVHPPLAKLLLFAGARLLGLDGDALLADGPAPALRLVPALAGVALIPLAYVLLRAVGGGRRIATLGATLLLADNALLVESRFVLTDPFLLLFMLGSATALTLAWGRDGLARRAYWTMAITLGAAAFSVKWTGLSALGLVAGAWGLEWWRGGQSRRALAGEGVLLAVIPPALYVGVFALHFALLPRVGTGGYFLSDDWRRTLRGAPDYDATRTHGFGARFIELNRRMMEINQGWANTTHAAASKWYTWPIAKHSIGYWSELREPRATASQRWIILFPNPLVWWGALIGMLATAIAAVRRVSRLCPHRLPLSALGMAYLGNLLPFAAISRPMYLYHYFPALLFGVLGATLGVGVLLRWDDEPERLFTGPWPSPRSRAAWGAIVGAVVALFVYLSPMNYGRPLTPEGVQHRKWILERH